MINLILSLALAAHADDVLLTPIRVEDASDRTTSVITADEIERRQARDLRDAFKDDAEVSVGGSQRAAQKVYVRALEDTNLNVTVDGGRQAGNLFRYQTRLNIDPELLKEVKVEAGTGDALAGPGALGGAIKFVTKDAEDLLAPGASIGALLKATYDTNASARGASLGLFGKPSETFSALAYLTLRESQDYKAGGGDVVPFSGGRPRAASIKMNYKPSVEHKISVGTNFTSDNAERLIRTNAGYTPMSPAGERKFETLNVNSGWDFVPAGGIHAVAIKTYFADNKLFNAAIASNARSKSQGLDVRDTIETKRWRLAYGAEGHLDTADASGSMSGGVERGTIFALYAQGRFLATERLKAQAGGRFDDYRLKTSDDNWSKGAHLSPNVSVDYRWTEAWSSRLGWNQAYRGPAPVEVMLLAFATSVATPENLRGTVAETIEFANEVKLSEAQTTLNLSLFSTVLQNPLETSLKNNAITRANADSDVTVRGLELKAKKSFGSTVDANVFYTRSVTKYGDGNIGYSGNFTRGVSLGDRVGVGAEWRLPASRVALKWNGTHVWKLENVPAGSPSQPGYDVHDVSAAWLATENLRAWVSVANVLDKKYVAQGSWYAGVSGQENALYEPGRDFRFAVAYQF